MWRDGVQNWCSREFLVKSWVKLLTTFNTTLQNGFYYKRKFFSRSKYALGTIFSVLLTNICSTDANKNYKQAALLPQASVPDDAYNKVHVHNKFLYLGRKSVARQLDISYISCCCTYSQSLAEKGEKEG